MYQSTEWSWYQGVQRGGGGNIGHSVNIIWFKTREGTQTEFITLSSSFHLQVEPKKSPASPGQRSTNQFLFPKAATPLHPRGSKVGHEDNYHPVPQQPAHHLWTEDSFIWLCSGSSRSVALVHRFLNPWWKNSQRTSLVQPEVVHERSSESQGGQARNPPNSECPLEPFKRHFSFCEKHYI